jgi:hypothetical protein
LLREVSFGLNFPKLLEVGKEEERRVLLDKDLQTGRNTGRLGKAGSLLWLEKGVW